LTPHSILLRSRFFLGHRVCAPFQRAEIQYAQVRVGSLAPLPVRYSQADRVDDEFRHPHRSWLHKFRDAFRGLGWSLRTQSSLHAHLAAAGVVLAVGAALRLSGIQWCLLVLCIALVFGLELLNTALERLAKAIDRRHNPDLGAALDIGSAAVLVGALGAVVVGAIIFAMRWFEGG
jgi:diacylglycerol kinase